MKIIVAALLYSTLPNLFKVTQNIYSSAIKTFVVNNNWASLVLQITLIASYLHMGPVK